MLLINFSISLSSELTDKSNKKTQLSAVNFDVWREEWFNRKWIFFMDALSQSLTCRVEMSLIQKKGVSRSVTYKSIGWTVYLYSLKIICDSFFE